jgi:hypothetical protein
MKEGPILFSGPMVRAILEDRKVQTRRVVMVRHNGPRGDGKLHVYGNEYQRWIQAGDDKSMWMADRPSITGGTAGGPWVRCPYGVPGDRLWVRETWCCIDSKVRPGARIAYRADTTDGERLRVDAPWKPSIHMPRWASRITLEITEVRVQRVQEISESDAKAEGADRDWRPEDDDRDAENNEDTNGYFPPKSYTSGFANLWDSINAKRGFGWDVNPWVWCITFKRVA